MNNTTMTIIGNLVDDPQLRITSRNQVPVASFRVASTPRRYDREQGCFVDDTTLFVNVSCWRWLAENVHASLRKGQPVVVTGRYYQREYEQNETRRIRYELEATAIGPDLSKGVAHFERSSRPSMAGSVPADEAGLPADDSAAYVDSLDRLQAAGFDTSSDEPSELNAVDLLTGELVAT